MALYNLFCADGFFVVGATMAYKWEWLGEGAEQILLIEFSDTSTTERWKEILKEALVGFAGGELKILCDMNKHEAAVNHEGFIEITELTKGFGVEKTAIAMQVNERFYNDKINLLEAFAKRIGTGLKMYAARDRAVAKKWLVDISF